MLSTSLLCLLMYGGLILLIARDYFNTTYLNKMHYFAWGANKQRILCDLIQVICFPLEDAEQTDIHFPDTEFRKIIDDNTVIYSHKSLDNNGMYTNGYSLNADLEKASFIRASNFKFISGLYLDDEERKNGKMDYPIKQAPNSRWHDVHPSDIFKDCFDGCGIVDITGLQSLNISINHQTWVDLNETDFRWLKLAGQKCFPFIIHPFRIDSMVMSARWHQPTAYSELYQEPLLWLEEPNDNVCSCGHYKKKNYQTPCVLHQDIMHEYVVQKHLKMFYYNQSQTGIKTAYTNGYGMGRFHGYLDPEFNKRVTKFMIKDGLHLSVDQYKELEKIYETDWKEQLKPNKYEAINYLVKKLDYVK
jgi:hypothetical protein